jgi:hypothetical protein
MRKTTKTLSQGISSGRGLSEALSWNLPERTEESTQILSKNSRCSFRDSDPAPPKTHTNCSAVLQYWLLPCTVCFEVGAVRDSRTPFNSFPTHHCLTSQRELLRMIRVSSQFIIYISHFQHMLICDDTTIPWVNCNGRKNTRKGTSWFEESR